MLTSEDLALSAKGCHKQRIILAGTRVPSRQSLLYAVLVLHVAVPCWKPRTPPRAVSAAKRSDVAVLYAWLETRAGSLLPIWVKDDGRNILHWP